MNKIISFTTIIALVIVIAANTDIDRNKEIEIWETSEKELNKLYKEGLNKWLTTCQDLSIKAKEFAEGKSTQELLQESFIQSRLAYKEIEAISNYSDPAYITQFINGAPLLKLEPKRTNINDVLEPKGYQIIDELIFSDEAIAEKEKIKILSSKLYSNAKNFAMLQKSMPITHRIAIEGARMQLVRMLTLGVTGFDTPASGNAIAETYANLIELEKLNDAITPLLEFNGDYNLANNTSELITQAQRFVKNNNDFDTFDRLSYLRDYLNPLFKNFLDYQQKLGIEFIYEVSDLMQSINFKSDNIFANDFIDPFYYAELTESEYNKEVIDLGKTLFFDPILSSQNERACASCHKPSMAFTDGNAKSIALNFDGTVSRNSPTLINAALADRYFYDLRALKLESQIEHVVVDDKEFHTNYLEIFDKLEQSDEYQSMFKSAFPNLNENLISEYTISASLAAYVISLTSFNSEFDKYVRYEQDEVSKEVRNGFNLFMGKAACGTCHFAPVFNGSVPPFYTESESEVLGVPATADKSAPYLDSDLGRAMGLEKEKGAEHLSNSFKTMTVRNIELTAPYMHNGVYKTLEQVMDFYNNGGGIGLGFDLPHQTLPPDSLHLTPREIDDIIAFMKSLTDTTGLTSMPKRLPKFTNKELNNRVIGGVY